MALPMLVKTGAINPVDPETMNETETESNATMYEAVDPADLEPGDEIIVHQISDGWDTVRGIVRKVKCKGGRYGVALDEPATGEQFCSIWEETGRTWTRVVDE